MTCFELLVTQMLASETSGNLLLKCVDYFKPCLPFCLRWTMLCYVMLCYVMLPVCYVTCMLCYYVILWRTHKTLAITLTAYTVCRIVRLLKQSSQFSRPVTLHDFIIWNKVSWTKDVPTNEYSTTWINVVVSLYLLKELCWKCFGSRQTLKEVIPPVSAVVSKS